MPGLTCAKICLRVVAILATAHPKWLRRVGGIYNPLVMRRVLMRATRIRLILFAFGFLVIGGWLGAFVSERLSTYRGGIASEAISVQANEAFYAKDLMRAEQLAFKAIPLDPDSYLPYELLGDIFMQRNETAAAITAYSLALQKLTENKGHYRVVRHLDPSMRQQELALLRDKLAKLKMRA
jgi:hypothetical protein